MTHKIAFCFITINDINNYHLWKLFFDSHYHKANIYLHPKYPNSVISFFNKYIISDLKKTSWGFFLEAIIAIFKTAYYSDHDNQYFVLLTDSDIPLKSFDYVYNNTNSNFLDYRQLNNYEKNKLIESKLFTNTTNIIKHTAHFILNRITLKKLLKTDLTNYIMLESGEEYFLSTLFYNPKLTFVKKCITYADWRKPHKLYLKYKKKYYHYIDNYNYDKAKYFLDKANEIRKHPTTFTKIPKYLFNVKCFFARKFLPMN
jgi:hypothetical protein